MIFESAFFFLCFACAVVADYDDATTLNGNFAYTSRNSISSSSPPTLLLLLYMCICLQLPLLSWEIGFYLNVLSHTPSHTSSIEWKLMTSNICSLFLHTIPRQRTRSLSRIDLLKRVGFRSLLLTYKFIHWE